jgi:hypothetical protein
MYDGMKRRDDNSKLRFINANWVLFPPSLYRVTLYVIFYEGKISVVLLSEINQCDSCTVFYFKTKSTELEMKKKKKICHLADYLKFLNLTHSWIHYTFGSFSHPPLLYRSYTQMIFFFFHAVCGMKVVWRRKKQRAKMSFFPILLRTIVLPTYSKFSQAKKKKCICICCVQHSRDITSKFLGRFYIFVLNS